MVIRLRRINISFAILAALLMTSVSIALADQPCDQISKVVPRKSEVATAASWANLRGHDGSLSVESKKMLGQAQTELKSLEKPADLCPANCKLSAAPAIEFKSIPNKFLSDYSDAPKCAKHLQATQKSPLLYTGKKFKDMDELNSWIGEFSQGKGDEGSDLYKKCDGDCSPQYTYEISPAVPSNGWKVDAQVVCGPARDKDENNYKLSYGFRWQCENS